MFKLRHRLRDWLWLGMALVLAAPSWASSQIAADSALQWIVQIRLNGVLQAQNAIILQDENKKLYATAPDLLAWHFRPPATTSSVTFEQNLYYPLHQYLQTVAKLDEQKLILDIQTPYFNFRENIISATLPLLQRFRPSTSGIYLDYDLSYSHAGSSSLAALTSLNIFGSYGVLNTSFAASELTQNPSLVRLATTWTLDQPEYLRTFRFGDTVNAAPSYSTGVQFVGIQMQRKFATNPNFLQLPGLSLTGNTRVPSAIELYLDNVRNWSSNLNFGPFSVNGIPIVTGSGDAVIVGTDLLGRRRVWEIPYYLGPTLLRAGLDDYDISLGLIRQNLGTQSFDYSQFLGTYRYRTGVSRSMTLGTSGEFLRTMQNFGVDMDFAIGKLGLGEIVFAVSNSEQGTGRYLSASFERSTEKLSLNMSMAHASSNFHNLLYFGTFAPPKFQSTTTLSTSTFLGSISGSLLYRATYEDTQSALLNMNYSTSIFDNISLQATTFFDLLQSDFGFFASLSFDMDPFGYTTAALQRSGDTFTPSLDLNQSAPSGIGYGYDFSITGGDSPSASTNITLNTSVANLNFTAQVDPSSLQWQMDAAGSVVFMKDHIFITRPIGQGFALVLVPNMPGIKIMSNQEIAGTTNQNGMVLVGDISPYQESSIGIDVDSVPFDAVLDDQAEKNIKTYQSSGALVEFGIRKSTGATLRVVDDQHNPIPSGASAHLATPNAPSLPVANDGMVYAKDLSASNQLVVEYNGQSCVVNFNYTPNSLDPIPFLGTFTCEATHQ